MNESKKLLERHSATLPINMSRLVPQMVGTEPVWALVLCKLGP